MSFLFQTGTATFRIWNTLRSQEKKVNVAQVTSVNKKRKTNTMMVQILNRTIFGRFGRSAHGSKYLSIFIVIYIFVHLVIFH